MFSFVSKSLLLHYGRRYNITTTIANYYSRDIAFPIFVKCTSTATAASNQHSVTVSYLMNSCGFSQTSALSASRHFHLNSLENADSVIDLLKSHGFSQTQVSKVIRRHPKLLCLSPDKILLPKLQFFYSTGFSSFDLVKISFKDSYFLHRSLENFIIPNFNSLRDVFKSTETAIAAVKCNPRILRLDVETDLAPSINVLRGIGVPERNILLFLKMWRCPGSTDLGTFRNTVEMVKEMGMNPLKSQFIIGVVAKLYGRTNWESRVNIYRSWGWSEEDFLAAFRKNPLFMTASKDKIMRVMDFLVNKMDLESSAIVKCPEVIMLSMEKRFIPRASVFQFLLSKGLINGKNTNLIRLFKLPEKSFLPKFVNSFDEAPDLLKLYQEKLAISKMTKTCVSRGRDFPAVTA